MQHVSISILKDLHLENNYTLSCLERKVPNIWRIVKEKKLVELFLEEGHPPSNWIAFLNQHKEDLSYIGRESDFNTWMRKLYFYSVSHSNLNEVSDREEAEVIQSRKLHGLSDCIGKRKGIPYEQWSYSEYHLPDEYRKDLMESENPVFHYTSDEDENGSDRDGSDGENEDEIPLFKRKMKAAAIENTPSP